MSDDIENSFVGERPWKSGWVEFLAGLRFSHAISLSWNRSVGIETATRHLKELHATVDEKLLGQRYDKKSADQRSFALFIFEKGASEGLHAHSLWRVKPEALLKFNSLFRDTRGGPWSRIVKSGSYKLDLIDDPMTFVRYPHKMQHEFSSAEQIVWSKDFLRAD